MHFPRILARSETLIASFRVWTQVADLFFHDDNRYAKHFVFVFCIYVLQYVHVCARVHVCVCVCVCIAQVCVQECGCMHLCNLSA